MGDDGPHWAYRGDQWVMMVTIGLTGGPMGDDGHYWAFQVCRECSHFVDWLCGLHECMWCVAQSLVHVHPLFPHNSIDWSHPVYLRQHNFNGTLSD